MNQYSIECTNTIENFNNLTSGVKLQDKKNLKLLCAPLFLKAIESTLNLKLENLILMGNCLKEID